MGSKVQHYDPKEKKNAKAYKKMLNVLVDQKIALGILYRLREMPQYWRVKKSAFTTIKLLNGWKNSAVGKVVRFDNGKYKKCAKIYT